MTRLMFVLAALPIAIAPAYASAGDWSEDVSNDGSALYAATSNDSGAILGEWCYPSTGKCNWLIGLDGNCEQDSAYPILANSDSGAASVMIRCGGKVGNTGLSQFAIVEYKDLESLMVDSKMIGFAFPLKSGQFRVVRFSLTGSHAVVSAMENKAARQYRTKQPDTRDTIL